MSKPSVNFYSGSRGRSARACRMPRGFRSCPSRPGSTASIVEYSDCTGLRHVSLLPRSLPGDAAAAAAPRSLPGDFAANAGPRSLTGDAAAAAVSARCCSSTTSPAPARADADARALGSPIILAIADCEVAACARPRSWPLALPSSALLVSLLTRSAPWSSHRMAPGTRPTDHRLLCPSPPTSTVREGNDS
jgi:hypothetical protein